MKIKVNKYFNGKTITQFLNEFYLSKSNIYKLKMAKSLLVNGEVKDFETVLIEEDVLDIDLGEIDKVVTPPSKIPINVLYEDDDIIIVEKKKGILIHSDGIAKDTLANRLAYYFLNTKQNVSVRVVHRIDFDTTGMVIFPKHLLSSSYLSYLFEHNLVEKKYSCLVWGNVKKDEGIISGFIAKDRHSNKQRVAKKGQSAETIYTVLNRFREKSELEVEIKGGRRHQIRVHLSSIGHPIVGDEMYGKGSNEELKLHFFHIGFTHPRYRNDFCYTIPKLRLDSLK